MADLYPNRRIPEGVDPQTWIGFEDRIGRRRFVAVIAIARDAVAIGDFAAAQAALDEARTLQPRAPELLDLELQVLAIAPARHGASYWSRLAGGVVLLAVGISLLIGLDALRRVQSVDVEEPASGLPVVVPARLPMAPLGFPLHGDIRVEEALLPTPVSSRAPVEAPLSPRLEARREPSRRGVEDRRAMRPRDDDAPLRSPRADAPSNTRQTSVAPRTSDAPVEPIDTDPANPLESSPPLAMHNDPAAAAPVVSPARVAIPAPPPAPDEATRVADVLTLYRRAYDHLDARAAREVWPSVDERALARAFDSLASQQLSFRDCDIDVEGATANVSCLGEARYVGKVGSSAPRIEPRRWRFELRRDGETWKIAHAEARRPTS